MESIYDYDYLTLNKIDKVDEVDLSRQSSHTALEARALEFEDMTATTNMVVSAELRESHNNISLTFRTTPDRLSRQAGREC